MSIIENYNPAWPSEFELAVRHANDAEACYAIKDPVYDLIWDAAQDWARNTGWIPNASI